MLRFLRDDGLVDRPLDQRLDLIGELAAGGVEEFDAVVFVGIVRCADDDAETAPELLRHVSDAGRGQRTDQHHVDAGRNESRLQRGLEEIAGQPRVLADKHTPAGGCQHPRRSTREPQRKIYRHGRLPDASAYSIGTEAAHRQPTGSAPWRPCNTALTMRTASRVGATSWVRMIRAPMETASAARPRPPYRRSSALRSRMRPMKLFRDTPTKQSHVVFQSFTKANPRIQHDGVLRHPRRQAGFARLHEEFGYLGHDILVERAVLHRTRLALHVHQTHSHSRPGSPLAGTGCPQSKDIVDDVRAGRGGCGHHARLAGIDGNRHVQGACDALDDRHDPLGLDGFLD